MSKRAAKQLFFGYELEYSTETIETNWRFARQEVGMFRFNTDKDRNIGIQYIHKTPLSFTFKPIKLSQADARKLRNGVKEAIKALDKDSQAS